MDDHPVGEIGEGTARFGVVFEQDDFRQALLVHQLRGQVFEHQRQKTQARAQAGRQRRLRHRAATEELKAAGLELARVHAKELVIAAPGQQAPESRVLRGRHPTVLGLQQRRINPDLVQDFIRGRARGTTLQQRFTHQLNGDGVFFRHGAR